MKNLKALSYKEYSSRYILVPFDFIKDISIKYLYRLKYFEVHAFALDDEMVKF